MAAHIPQDLGDAVRARAQLCFQCGVCMGGCPVARVNERFHPRRLMGEIALGGWEAVLRGDAIWLCAQCHVCVETCPQGVGISDLIVDLRNIAVAVGVTPPKPYVENVRRLAESGRLVSLTPRVERLRERLALGGVRPAAAEVRNLIRDTRFGELADGEVERR